MSIQNILIISIQVFPFTKPILITVAFNFEWKLLARWSSYVNKYSWYLSKVKYLNKLMIQSTQRLTVIWNMYLIVKTKYSVIHVASAINIIF